MKTLMIGILTLMTSNIVLAQKKGSDSKSPQTGKGQKSSDSSKSPFMPPKF